MIDIRLSDLTPGNAKDFWQNHDVWKTNYTKLSQTLFYFERKNMIAQNIDVENNFTKKVFLF